MEIFIDNILYIALFVTIITSIVLFVKNKRNDNTSGRPNQMSHHEFEIKLRAYERLILFLDRIEPVGMINRLALHQLDIETTSSTLIKNIILEYEYNVSQQIYVSDALWDLIELVKNKIINNISSSANSLDKNAQTELLMKTLLNNSKENNVLINQAQKILKKEIRLLS